MQKCISNRKNILVVGGGGGDISKLGGDNRNSLALTGRAIAQLISQQVHLGKTDICIPS